MALLEKALEATKAEESASVNISSISRFVSPVIIDRETCFAYLTIKETKEQGHRIYSMELMEIKKLDPIMGRPRIESKHFPDSSFRRRLSDLIEKGNSKEDFAFFAKISSSVNGPITISQASKEAPGRDLSALNDTRPLADLDSNVNDSPIRHFPIVKL